jgi:Ca-activated chloride channel family protein
MRKIGSGRLPLLQLWMSLCLLITLAVGPSVGTAASTEQKIEAVLAIDASTSMNQSDQNKVANEAMKMFVDMASVQGDKIGVVSYTDQVVREKALLKINSAQDKEDLKGFMDQLTRGPYTDIAVGVSEAVKILEADRETGHYPLIVLLTDGNNSLQAGRTQAQSDQQLQEAVKKAQSQGIPIYTIGLNADGQLNKVVLDKISQDTKGKSFVTSSAESLPQILSEIFASHLKLKVIPLDGFVANGEYQDVKVSIPNANVLEANISIMSAQPVEAKLFAPDGKEHPIPSDGVVYSKSNSYSLIKILKPVQGDWKLQVKGINQQKIDINLIFNYDVQLMLQAPSAKTFKAGDAVDIRAHLESNGQQLTDADLFKNMKSKLLVTDLDTKQSVEQPLTNTGKDFTGSWKVPDSHEYEIKVLVEDSSFFRESAPLAINAKNAASQTATPAPTSAATPAPIVTEPKEPLPWLKILIGVLGLLLLIAVVLFILSRVKQANKGFYGQIVIEIRDEDTGERTSPQYRKLDAFKGKVKLHQLLQLAPELAETDKIVFTPGRDSIIMVNQSQCLIEKAGRAFDASKGKELKNNDRIKITLQKVNKSIWLDYII